MRKGACEYCKCSRFDYILVENDDVDNNNRLIDFRYHL